MQGRGVGPNPKRFVVRYEIALKNGPIDKSDVAFDNFAKGIAGGIEFGAVDGIEKFVSDKEDVGHVGPCAII